MKFSFIVFVTPPPTFLLQAVKYEMKDFVVSDNSQLAVIYIQKGSMFRRLKGIKATFVQVFYYGLRNKTGNLSPSFSNVKAHLF